MFLPLVTFLRFIQQTVIKLLTILFSPGSALSAQSPKNDFAFANNPFTEGARRWAGHFVPIDILNIAAAVADEMVMAHTFRIKARGTALDSDFADQSCVHQVPKIVIGGGS
jgi:hypothetical protein